MADLIVDMDALSALQNSLTFVNDDFKNLAGDINGIDHASEWGSEKIRSGMDTFQHNWRAHRTKLEAAIDALLQMVTQTTQIFQDVDRQLAKEMTDAQTEQVIS